jgi:hypothetical protein
MSGKDASAGTDPSEWVGAGTAGAVAARGAATGAGTGAGAAETPTSRGKRQAEQ